MIALTLSCAFGSELPELVTCFAQLNPKGVVFAEHLPPPIRGDGSTTGQSGTMNILRPAFSPHPQILDPNPSLNPNRNPNPNLPPPFPPRPPVKPQAAFGPLSAFGHSVFGFFQSALCT